jgi:hypothetical protein
MLYNVCLSRSLNSEIETMCTSAIKTSIFTTIPSDAQVRKYARSVISITLY